VRRFCRANRGLLIIFFGIVTFFVIADLFDRAAFNPATSDRRFNIESKPDSNVKFRIVTWEPYRATLWIGQPNNLDRRTFDLVTGCQDDSNMSRQAVQTPEWTIRSVSDQRVVIQRKATLINPPADECSSTTGGHVFALGDLAPGPGQYQFELKFGSEIPESMNFPAELSITCSCGREAQTRLGSLALFLPYVALPMVFAFIFTASALIFRAGFSIGTAASAKLAIASRVFAAVRRNSERTDR
jgi:hypothetical protein